MYVKDKVFCPTFFQKSWWSLRCCCVLELRCYCGRTITEHHRLKRESVAYVKEKVFGQAFFKKLVGLDKVQDLYLLVTPFLFFSYNV